MVSGSVTAVDQTSISSWKLVGVASIAAGVQFAWALQISLLTPYIQTLGVSHAFASFMWLYGAFSGMVVQPFLGYRSDRCTCRFGRRRPFIAAGAAIACVSFVLIGYSKDIGYMTGDSLDGDVKFRAVVAFLLGFWLLDISNNTLQGPCRALLADLCFLDHEAMKTSMNWYSFFTAFGNVLGYTAGAYGKLQLYFPFTSTTACDDNCANVKSCFCIAIVILLIVTVIAISSVSELQLSEEYVKRRFDNQTTTSFVEQLIYMVSNMERPMWLLLLVTFLNWMAWFPFLLFGSDWSGKEVFRGEVNGEGIYKLRYETGVRMGALGLLSNSVVMALMSLVIDKAGHWSGGMKNLWGMTSFLLSGGLMGTVVITKVAGEWWRNEATSGTWLPSFNILSGTWLVYALLGISLAATYSIPFTMATIYCSINGGGQGLSLGVLNLAIVIPQIMVSIGAGAFGSLFGGSYAPSFAIGAVLASISAILSIFLLPDPLHLIALTKSTTI